MKTKSGRKAKVNGKHMRAAMATAGKKGGEKVLIEFTPTRTLPLTVNGRTIEVHAGAKTMIPPEYKAVYDSAS